MISKKDMANAKKGDSWKIGSLIPGVTSESLNVEVVSKYKTRVTCLMTFFGIPMAKFVYHKDTESLEEVPI